MTTYHSGYVIALEHDIREDDLEKVIDALKMIKGVVAVEPVISSPDLQIAQMRADNGWRNRIMDMVRTHAGNY